MPLGPPSISSAWPLSLDESFASASGRAITISAVAPDVLEVNGILRVNEVVDAVAGGGRAPSQHSARPSLCRGVGGEFVDIPLLIRPNI